MKHRTNQDRLVIRLDIQPEFDEYWWLPAASAARQVQQQQAAELSQKLPAQVLLDSRAIRLDWLEKPPGVKNTEAGLLLEDQLCQPLEEVEIGVLQSKGRRLRTAVLDQQQAKDWQQRLQDAGIRVNTWLPEALCYEQAWQQSSVLLLQEQHQHWLYQPQTCSLLSLRAGLLDAGNLSRLAGDRPIQPLNVADLPDTSRVVWLARHQPAGITLWKAPLWSKTPAGRWLAKVKKLQPAQLLMLAPWMVILLALGLQLLMQGWGGSKEDVRSRLSQTLVEVMGTEAALDNARLLLDARLERSIQLRHWQQQRLDAWAQLEKHLVRARHLKLQHLSLNKQGIRAELVGVTPADHQTLQQLNGRWQFSDHQAIWELEL